MEQLVDIYYFNIHLEKSSKKKDFDIILYLYFFNVYNIDNLHKINHHVQINI